MQEVGDKTIQDIKSECLADFAYNLQSLIWSNETWSFNSNYGVNRTCDSSSPIFSTIAHYKTYENSFGHSIKYNSKNIVFEELISNDKSKSRGVQGTCADMYGLTKDQDGTYSYTKVRLTCATRYPNVGCECSPEEVSAAKSDALRDFHLFFGAGEFPFINIHVIRIGNVDHYFYTITR